MIMKDIESFFQCENERSDAERKARLKEKGARMIVLETQSWNSRARDFIKYGFELIGLDAHAYSNQDIEKKDVRLEFDLKMN